MSTARWARIRWRWSPSLDKTSLQALKLHKLKTTIHWLSDLRGWSVELHAHIWLYRPFRRLDDQVKHTTSKAVRTFKTFIQPIKIVCFGCSSQRKSSVCEPRLETQVYMWKHDTQQVICKSLSKSKSFLTRQNVFRTISIEMSHFQSNPEYCSNQGCLGAFKKFVFWRDKLNKLSQRAGLDKCLKAIRKRGGIWGSPWFVQWLKMWQMCTSVRKSH